MKKPTTKLMSIEDIKENPINPRFIEEEDYEKLLDSIREFPNMLQLRPIVIDLNNTVVGGNQRLRACKELELEKVPTMQVTKEMLSEVNEARKAAKKPTKKGGYRNSLVFYPLKSFKNYE